MRIYQMKFIKYITLFLKVFGETIGSIVDPVVVPVWRNANPVIIFFNT